MDFLKAVEFSRKRTRARVVSLFEVEDVFEGEVVEVVPGFLVLGAHKQDVEAGLDGVIST